MSLHVKTSFVLVCMLAVLGARAAAATISGNIVDAATGRPLAGITVAAAPYDGDFSSPLAGDAASSGGPGSFAVTAADGSYTLAVDDTAAPIALDVYGGTQGFVTYHGVFAAGTTGIPQLRMIQPTVTEQRALNQINSFRRAPGGRAQFGDAQPLVFDRNLVLAARYWASEERHAHRIGHTCAQLGNPDSCIEFNAYFHSLAGAPQGDDSGQNTAFDTDASWSAANRLFEIEGALCRYNWRACPGGADGSAAQTGHYINLMAARRWIGLGEATAPGDGSYFTVNLL
jgi:hypothetical protein